MSEIFYKESLDESARMVREAYPHLVALADEANKLLPKPYFHFNAWKQFDDGPVYVDLLYGDHDLDPSLQLLGYSLPQIQTALQGFINGFRAGQQSMKGA